MRLIFAAGALGQGGWLFVIMIVDYFSTPVLGHTDVAVHSASGLGQHASLTTFLLAWQQLCSCSSALLCMKNLCNDMDSWKQWDYHVCSGFACLMHQGNRVF
mmetsp:Transcript_243/g.692  ORF Transcript_243/g.692 Transcript_243/m.692 type:complete len:102 (+) Transcript_243:1274-1579(+)